MQILTDGAQQIFEPACLQMANSSVMSAPTLNYASESNVSTSGVLQAGATLPPGTTIQKAEDGLLQMVSMGPDGRQVVSKAVTPGLYFQQNPDGTQSVVSIHAS